MNAPRTVVRALQVAAVIASLPCASPSALADFNYPNFSNPSGLSLIQNAVIDSSTLRLTPLSPGIAGTVWYTDHKVNLRTGFSTEFTLQITRGDSIGGEGMAFVIQNSRPDYENASARSLGYSGIWPAVAIEFDTVRNQSSHDPVADHMAVMSGQQYTGTDHSHELGVWEYPPGLDDGTPFRVTVSYDGSRLRVDYLSDGAPEIDIPLNLDAIGSTSVLDANGMAWVGFTARAGVTYSEHRVLDWSFDEAECTIEARWIGSEPAHGEAPQPGVFGQVRDLLTLPNGDLIAAGEFYSAGVAAVGHIARWDGTTWSALGLGLNGPSEAVAVLHNGDIVVGGRFLAASGTPASLIARWNGTSWAPMSSGMSGGADPHVKALSVLPNGDLIAAGRFVLAGDVVVNGIARWDGSTWNALGAGLNDRATAVLGLPDGRVVVGGLFTMAGSVSANRIALWDGSTWSAMADGLTSTPNALAVLPNGTIVAGGGGVFFWDGAAWYTPPNSPGSYDLLVLPNGDLLSAVAGISRWDGQSWSRFRGNTNGSNPQSLAVLENGDLVLAGLFSTAGGVGYNYRDAVPASSFVRYRTVYGPRFSTTPISTSICPFGAASFSVDAVEATSFRWQVDLGSLEAPEWADLIDGPLPSSLGSAATVSGAATGTLIISNADFAAAARYRAAVDSPCGLGHTSPVSLTVCAADWNCTGGPDSEDLFLFLEDYFAGHADLNHDGRTNNRDYRDFLEAFFSGC